MPQVIVTEGATQGVGALSAILAIEHQFALLEAETEIDRPFDDQSELRELIIPFGDSGYVALYHFDVIAGYVYVLAFRHQKEAGY